MWHRIRPANVWIGIDREIAEVGLLAEGVSLPGRGPSDFGGWSGMRAFMDAPPAFCRWLRAPIAGGREPWRAGVMAGFPGDRVAGLPGTGGNICEHDQPNSEIAPSVAGALQG
jgi:hypothetical protein